VSLSWQPSLLGAGGPRIDPGLAGIERVELGEGAWLDHLPGWVTGTDELFETVLAEAPWQSRERPMYDRMVVEPRLTTGEWADPPAPVAAMGDALSAHYDRDLHVVSANLYRSGRDSVAWHGDRIGRRQAETVVAIVSLGCARRFLLRPTGGGASRRYLTQAGDLLVLGGSCQRTFQHSVPKCREAGPRISVMFREAY
jgi:alkylated DNA repair dioxygenase AlkB